MLANFIQLFAPRAPDGSAAYDLAFVREVSIESRMPRDRRLERVIIGSWVLIALKCWIIIWAIGHYHIPISPLSINVPTVVFALLCTAAYRWRQ